MGRPGARSRSGRGGSENEVQVAESYGSALDGVQADFVQQGNHLAKVEIHVLTEVRDQAAPLLSGSSKIHGEQPAARLQNPAYLRKTLSAGLFGQVMKHHGAQYAVECRVREWQLLSSGIFENYFDAAFPGLLARSLDHLR